MNVIVENRGMKITKISPNIGAEVTGIDLSKPISAETQQMLMDALVDNIALVIRGQEFTAAQFLAAVELFGEAMPQVDPEFSHPDVPLVLILSNRQTTKSGAPQKVGKPNWHTDQTHFERPPKFTALYPVELPSSGGGTSVANMQAAYEALSESWKQKITGMRTMNVRLGSAVKRSGPSSAAEDQAKNKPTPVEQPLVRTHPETGKKAVYFHHSKVENIIGMSPEDSQDFLAKLVEQVIRPEFVYTHQWRMGDMLIWDNRSALHRAGIDYDHNEHRMLYRAIVQGDRPF